MSKKFHPTLFQHLATDLNRNLAVTAGAGTGKTAVLTRRIIKILKEGEIYLNNIVVVTFTEKAALELKERIGDVIDSEIEDNNYAHFKDVKDCFLNNYINTIHGFCASILREYPVEADVDPYFRVLDETDKIFLLRHAIRQSLTELAETKDPDIIRLSNELTRNEIINIIFDIIQKREEVYPWLLKIQNIDWKIQIDRIKNYRDIILREICFKLHRTKELNRCLSLLKAVKSEIKNDISKYTEALNNLIDTIPELISTLKNFEPCDEAVENIIILRDKIKGCCKLRGKPPKKWLNASHALDTFKKVTAILNFYLLDLDLENFAFKHLHEKEGFILTKSLAKTTIFCISRYQHEKDRLCYLDFQDLQLKTLEFLLKKENRSVRNELRKKFHYIMVDEFQDTNSLQWEIIRIIACDENNIIDKKKVFIVGDEKQSIYAFRGGDVSLFLKVRKELKNANIQYETYKKPYSFILSQEMDYTNEYNSSACDKEQMQFGEISFTDNFRSAQIPVRFFNEFFYSLLFQEYYEDYEARPQHLEAKGNSNEGSVEIFLVEKEPGENAGNLYIKEAEMMIYKIREVIEGDDPRYERVRQKALKGEPAIAILLNRRTRLKVYEDVLRRQGLNFVVVRGQGFFQRQEILDISNILSFLSDMTNSLLLTGILRSDMFHIADESIFLLQEKVQGKNLWEKLKNTCICDTYNNLFDVDTDLSLKFAFTCLSDWNLLKDKLNLPEFLLEILKRTGFWINLPRGYRGEQALSNMEKLIEMARTVCFTEQEGFVYFSKWLENRVNLIQDEGEADVNASLGSAIQLMTVHQSKGLEFPLVFIPDMTATFNLGEKDSFCSSKITEDLKIRKNDFKRKLIFEAGINAPDPENEYQSTPTLIKRIIQYNIRQKLIAERKRLFYVAATRTQDHLILVGQIDPGNNRKKKIVYNAPLNQLKCWMDWVSRILNLYYIPDSDLRGTITLNPEDRNSIKISFLKYNGITIGAGAIKELVSEIVI